MTAGLVNDETFKLFCFIYLLISLTKWNSESFTTENPLAFSFSYLSLFLLPHLSGDLWMKRVPLHSSAFLKPPLISHRSSSTEGGMGMTWSRWTLAGIQGGKGGQFVGQCWWDMEEWRPCPSSRCSQFQPSLQLLMELVHLSLSSSLLSSSLKPCQKRPP